VQYNVSVRVVGVVLNEERVRMLLGWLVGSVVKGCWKGGVVSRGSGEIKKVAVSCDWT
jgi:hypothetical protein